MPAPAAGVEEATLLEWSVEDHAAFAAADVLLVIETDKAVIDVEAETTGVLHRKLVTAGRSVAVGAPLAVIGSADDSEADIEALVAEAGASSPTTATDAESAAAPGAAAAPPGGKHGYDAAPGPAEPAAPSAPVPTPAAANGAPAAAPGGTGGRIFASPIARQMAKAAGLTLDELTGTGPGGRIVRWDVEQAAAQRRAVAASAPVAAAPAAAAAGHAAPSGERSFTDEPHSKLRSAIASRLTFSKQTVPHFYVRATPRVDALIALRKELNAGGGPKISVNDLVVRAVARAHRLVPAANVIFLDTAMRRFDYVDIAVAVATDGGLVTPVLRDVDRTPISEIAAATADFAARARSGRLRQHELEGGSITVTNLGMFGTEEFSAIINPPHSAILAVGAARPEPVAVNGADGPELTVATVMHLMLSVDHRAVDGALAAEWMAALTTVLEHPIQILA